MKYAVPNRVCFHCLDVDKTLTVSIKSDIQLSADILVVQLRDVLGRPILKNDIKDMLAFFAENVLQKRTSSEKVAEYSRIRILISLGVPGQ